MTTRRRKKIQRPEAYSVTAHGDDNFCLIGKTLCDTASDICIRVGPVAPACLHVAVKVCHRQLNLSTGSRDLLK